MVSQERALPEELVLAAKKPGRHMICACLHTTGPLHYTLLCMQREADSQWQMRYYDTLPSPSQSAYEKSRQLLKLVLETAKADSQGLPAPCNFYKQKDGFSCGLWVLLYLEKELRQWSGEAAQATKPEPEKVADRLNRWVKFLLTSQAVEQMRQEAAADQPSARKQEAAEPEPPLPPPQRLLQVQASQWSMCGGAPSAEETERPRPPVRLSQSQHWLLRSQSQRLVLKLKAEAEAEVEAEANRHRPAWHRKGRSVSFLGTPLTTYQEGRS